MTDSTYQSLKVRDPIRWEYLRYLDEIEDELPNQNFASNDDSDESHLEDELDSYTPISVNTRQSYAANRSKEQHLKQHLQRAHDEALNEYIKENPDSHNLKVRTSTSITAKPEGTINFNAAYAAFMSCLLDREQTLKTQKAILEYVKRETAIQALTANFWTMPLKSFAKRALQKRINNADLNISLSGCSTLSDVRKACSAYFIRAKAELKATVKVSITDEVLVINNVSYPIITSKVGKSTYRRICVVLHGKKSWMRVDCMEHLLLSKKSKN